MSRSSTNINIAKRYKVAKALNSDQDQAHRLEILDKFVNCIMIDGKKITAEKIVAKSLQEVAEQMNKSLSENQNKEEEFKPKTTLDCLLDSLNKVGPTVMAIPRRVGGSVHNVPTNVSFSQRIRCAMRFIITSSRKRSEKTFAERLKSELLDILNDRPCGSRKMLENVIAVVKANIAFMHYRW